MSNLDIERKILHELCQMQQVTLQAVPITTIDLVDHSSPSTGQGPETVPYQVVWQVTGLTNTQHNLLISVGVRQPYAVVDGLMYVLSLSIFSS
jgi:hypothetical protein